MPEQHSFEAFMQEVMQREMPENRMARVRTLAKELAEGALEGFWEVRDPVNSGECRAYLQERWNDQVYPYLSLLEPNGYVRHNELDKAAFDLVQEAELADVFISYRRKDSSAFALLVLKSLKEAGLNVFLDMTIQPGANWQTHLREQIQKRDYFVVLIGRESLTSKVLHQELLWALEAGANVIPIWHGGFLYTTGEFSLPPEIDHILSTTHTIRVLEESALAYNNAIVELLNRFGITP